MKTRFINVRERKVARITLVFATLLALAAGSNLFKSHSHFTVICERVAVAQDETLDLSALDDASNVSAATDETTENQPDSPSPSSSQKTTADAQRARFIDLALAGGWIGVILLAGSVLAVALIIRISLALRRSSFAPREDIRKLSTLIEQKEYASAMAFTERSDSPLSKVVGAGLKEIDRGWDATEKALEDAVSQESAAFNRRTEPLSIIGNVAPMLGLLGTVVGMVTTFGEIAVSDGSGRNLANGIYFALVTTVEGLIVAIPILVAHSLLTSRIASLFDLLTKELENVFAGVKRESARGISKSSFTDASGRPQSSVSARQRAVQGLREITTPNAENYPGAASTVEASVENRPGGTGKVGDRRSLTLKGTRREVE